MTLGKAKWLRIQKKTVWTEYEMDDEENRTWLSKQIKYETET